MATTRYVVSATASHEEKIISNLKAAKTEADLRAKGDRETVTVTTLATKKLSYVAEAPASAQAAPAEPEVEETEADGQEEDFTAVMAEVLAEAAQENEDGDKDGDEDEEGEEEPDAGRRAACGCLVEHIIATGDHQDCAESAKAKAKAQAVKKDTPARRTSRRAARREALGESVVPGWELLYDKPRQDAQVGRKDGKYALICTRHKTAHPLAKLVEERKLRQGERTTWCSECTD